MSAIEPLPEFVRVTRGRKTALMHPAYREAVEGALLDGTGCVEAGRVGRGPLMEFDFPGGRGLVRRYRRGGLPRRFLKESYLFRNRPLRELAVHRYAHDAGLPVPLPLGAMWERRGPVYRGAFATQAVDAVHLLEYIKTTPDVEASELTRCGELVRRMHEAGIWHADLQIRNLLVGPGGPYLIDLDGARRFGTMSARRRRGNLLRLRRSFLKNGVDLSHFETIQRGYDLAL